MKRFVFKLEPLCDYRKRLEDICKEEFGDALKRLSDEETKLELLKEVYRRSSGEICDMKENGAPMDEFGLYYAYITKVRSHIDEQERIISDVMTHFEENRKKQTDASRNMKILEMIKEKSYALRMERGRKLGRKAG